MVLQQMDSRALCQQAPLVSRQVLLLCREIVERRLRQALWREAFSLIWECYEPANKMSTPYCFATYVCTEGASLSPGGLFCLFSLGGEESKLVCFTLESYEPFVQLCMQANLVKLGPRKGMFADIVPCFEETLRVKREWLDAARDGEERVFWFGAGEVGLRCVFRHRAWQDREPDGVLLVAVDEMPARYEVEFTEMMLRSSHVLQRLEESARHESQMALVIGSFA